VKVVRLLFYGVLPKFRALAFRPRYVGYRKRACYLFARGVHRDKFRAFNAITTTKGENPFGSGRAASFTAVNIRVTFVVN